MRLRTLIRFLSFTLFLPFLALPARAEEFANALQAYLQQCVHAQIPKGCVVVGLMEERGSRIVSCGTLDNGTDQEANGDTVFALHSLTGTFTSLLLQEMVERGEMKLDDPAARYLPEAVKLPTRNGKEITLRHLVTETSGLPPFLGTLHPKRAENPLADFTLEQLDAFVSGCQLTNAPGAIHFHGGVDKGLLGQTMARQAGTDYEALFTERICRPLELNHTRFSLTPEMQSRLASEHNPFGYAIPSVQWAALKPLAGLYSTPNDLLQFISALDHTPSRLAPLLEKGKWGFYFPGTSQGGAIAYTGGGGFGGRALAGYDQTRRRGVVILSTSTDFMRNFGDFLLESEWQSERRPKVTNIGPWLLDSYVGQYRLQSDTPSRQFTLWPFSRHQEPTNSQSFIGIRRQGDRLFAQAASPSVSPTNLLLLPPITAELLPESETRFFERLSGNPVTFSRDAQGKVTDLTIERQGKAFAYVKISEQPPQAPEPVKPRVAIKLDPKLLDACVGHYELIPKAPFPSGGKVTIWREGDQLLGQVQGENALKGAFAIYPESETNFFLKINGAQLTVLKNALGQVTTLIHHSARPGVPDAEARKLKE